MCGSRAEKTKRKFVWNTLGHLGWDKRRKMDGWIVKIIIESGLGMCFLGRIREENLETIFTKSVHLALLLHLLLSCEWDVWYLPIISFVSRAIFFILSFLVKILCSVSFALSMKYPKSVWFDIWHLPCRLVVDLN